MSCDCNKDKGYCSCGKGSPFIGRPTPTVDRVEVLRFIKEPVERVSDLYARYPDGGEWGWIAFVRDKATFAYWDEETRGWELISNNHPEQLLRLFYAQISDGDTFVWNAEAEQFELFPLKERLEAIDKVLGSSHFFEVETDFCRFPVGGGSFNTRVISEVGFGENAERVAWVIDDSVALPDWLSTRIDGERLFITAKEY